MYKFLVFVFALVLTCPLAFAADLEELYNPAGTAKGMKEKATGLLDINTASEGQLQKLPGIGDKYSKKIIEGRPFTNKEELVSKKIIPSSVYEKIQGLITAK